MTAGSAGSGGHPAAGLRGGLVARNEAAHGQA